MPPPPPPHRRWRFGARQFAGGGLEGETVVVDAGDFSHRGFKVDQPSNLAVTVFPSGMVSVRS